MNFDIVFEGGGAKGIAFLGALAALEEHGHAPARIVGTSAGAIFATLVAAGFDATALREAVARRDESGTLLLANFMDTPPPATEEEVTRSGLLALLERLDLPLLPASIEARIDHAVAEGLLKLTLVRQLVSLGDRGGLYVGDAFYHWMRALLDERHPGLGTASFAEFYRITGRDLSLVATDTDARLMLVLNHRTAPSLPVAWAVRMSMGIPFVWQEVLWRAEWGLYLDRDLTGHAIVDGGILSNFPMQLIATQLAEVVAVMGDTDPMAVPNLGFLIDENLADPRFETKAAAPALLHGPLQRVARVVQTVIGARDQLVIERCLQNDEVCRLPARGYGTTEFDMNQARFDALADSGYTATSAYLTRRLGARGPE